MTRSITYGALSVIYEVSKDSFTFCHHGSGSSPGFEVKRCIQVMVADGCLNMPNFHILATTTQGGGTNGCAKKLEYRSRANQMTTPYTLQMQLAWALIMLWAQQDMKQAVRCGHSVLPHL